MNQEENFWNNCCSWHSYTSHHVYKKMEPILWKERVNGDVSSNSMNIHNYDICYWKFTPCLVTSYITGCMPLLSLFPEGIFSLNLGTISTIFQLHLKSTDRGQLVPGGIICPVVGAEELTWFTRYIYYRNLQL